MSQNYPKVKVSEEVRNQMSEFIDDTEYSMRRFVDEAVKDKIEGKSQQTRAESRRPRDKHESTRFQPR